MRGVVYVGVGEQLAALTEHVRGIDVQVRDLGQACKDLANTTVSERMCQERCGRRRDWLATVTAFLALVGAIVGAVLK